MAEEVVNEQAQLQEGGEVQKPQVTAEAGSQTEEGTITLPSDDTFVMPEKFEGKTAEEIARSYIELEKFKGQPSTPTEGTEETPSQEPEDGSGADKYFQEYLDKGELSEESYAELEKQGLSRKDVDDRLEFEEYKNKKVVDDLVSVIGGIENFQAMDEWSKETLTPDELKQVSQELSSASDYGKKAILKDLYGKYKRSTGGEGEEGDVIHTNEPQAVITSGYTSQHELQADMADPRYGTDRSYTKAVEDKLSKSKNF